MNIAFLFPGQGSQKTGMLHQLIADPIVDETFREMSEALAVDVLTLDSEAALRSTVAAQLALLAAGVASARTLIARNICPIAVAGLSIGAFGAAVIAGSISLRDAAYLVQFRATRMEMLYAQGYGLAVLVGYTEQQANRLVAAITTPSHPIFVGNINAPRQIVLAGSIDALQQAIAAALRHGASRAELLPVSVPSHCPLLADVADALRERLSGINISNPRFLYISNVSARSIHTAAGVAADLADNIAHSVRWHEATTVLKELGAGLFLEMPPGHVLTDLARANIPDIEAHPVIPSRLDYLLQRAAT